jgi:hypothetical protein
MIGSRREDACHYSVNETAARYDASVSQDTDDPVEAYADRRAVVRTSGFPTRFRPGDRWSGARPPGGDQVSPHPGGISRRGLVA